MAMEKIDLTYAKNMEIRAPTAEEEKNQRESWGIYREKYNNETLTKSSQSWFYPKTTPSATVVRTDIASVTPIPVQQYSPSMSMIPSVNRYQAAEQDKDKTANFDFEIIGHFIKKFTREDGKEFVKIKLRLLDDYDSFQMDIPTSEYKDLKNKIRSVYPQCYIYDEEKFNRYAAEKYGSTVKHLPTEYFYNFGGWIYERDRLVFLHNGMANVSADVELNNPGYINEFLYYYKNLSNSTDKLWLMLIYSLWANLAIFYKEKDLYGLRCAMYLSALSSTGKTSVAQILAKALLKKGCKSELRFDDTKASLEENILKRKDIVLLIDDFYPQGNKLGDADFKSKASEIMRIVGDGSVKEKMGSDRKPLLGREYRGGIIVTGEYVDLNTYSSHLRCWILNLRKGDIEYKSGMDLLQQNPEIAKGFFSAWVFYLEKFQDDILANVSIRHKDSLNCVKERYPEAPTRFISNVAAFLVTARFFSEFCQYYQANIDTNDVINAIWNESDEQFKLLKLMSPAEVVQAAVNYAIDNGNLIISDTEEEFKTNKDSAGFYQDGWIYVITGKLDSIIKDFADKKQYGVQFNDDVKGALFEKGLMQKDGSGYNFKYSQNRSVSPKRPRIYKISERMIKND